MAFSPFSLQAESLSYKIAETPLFQPVDFTIKSGQALIVRGANGIGKTTLLRIAAGLLKSASGTLSITEKVASTAPLCHYLGHKNGLKLSKTVRQNLSFWAALGGGQTKSEIQTRTIKAAEALNVSALLDLRAGVLSAGQKRRAAFARLLTAPRALWILDEPSAALDRASSDLAQQVCRAHILEGGAIIAATHLPFFSESDDDFLVSNLTLTAPHVETAS